LIGRISLKAAQPRDLIALKNSIAQLPEIEKNLRHLKDATAENLHPAIIAEHLKAWDNMEDVYRLLDEAVVPEPPFSLKEGGVIRPGYLPELDELRRFQKEGRSMLTNIEQRERTRTGIDSLKVRYNQVHGYYIEISKTRISKIPADYIRKQTLANAERYMTAELKTLEEKLTGAKDAIIALEARVFEDIRANLAPETGRVQHMAKTLAVLDFLSALAECAHLHHYCKPVVNDEDLIRMTEGRHPVLEAGMSGGKDGFVPNDTRIHPPGARLLLLTGPNMAGKSTYMRQIALIVLMAQMGGYVPARKAVIGVADQIFTRVGAQDALTEGMSTFMVEMTEMSQILRHATGKSLILLDEIGRGTSTFDGVSIAWAIAEYVHDTLKARTLFATHYHELTGLSILYPGIKNYHVLVREWGEEIVFLRKMVEGGSDKSYGIQVARLAGLPQDIIRRAKAVLKTLDQKSDRAPLHERIAKKTDTDALDQPGLFTAPPKKTPEPDVQFQQHPVIEALKKINPMHLTPMQALQQLADLKTELENSDEMEQPGNTLD
ncbi:MAG: DNA mismatch repair protein MutS, partial [Nitrospiria bacterium]